MYYMLLALRCRHTHSCIIQPFVFMFNISSGRFCGCELCPPGLHLPWTQVTHNRNGNLGRWFVAVRCFQFSLSFII
ncbi:hypothetical protein K435DRAFT_336959 [Dendrothele bispora CBS 962.96]|uniref:Uncharacterized protein n=1 Tax=Dendrothele bispora (strain CBS 962.96) TaxID=1314807 RepID=A0A4S8LFX5_DENBC|nr:hypothetical protein K435DRAFT_336959 [Dendrothele bispora CBS 962.96]